MRNGKIQTNKIFTLIITISLVLEFINSVLLIVNKNDVECIYKDSTPEKGLSGKYLFAGKNEENNIVFINNSNNITVWSNQGKKNSDFKVTVDKEQLYQICFENLEKDYLVVSFDLYNEEKLNNIVSTQSITDMNKNIHEMRKRIDILHHDIKNSAIRRKVHTDSKLNYYSY